MKSDFLQMVLPTLARMLRTCVDWAWFPFGNFVRRRTESWRHSCPYTILGCPEFWHIFNNIL